MPDYPGTMPEPAPAKSSALPNQNPDDSQPAPPCHPEIAGSGPGVVRHEVEDQVQVKDQVNTHGDVCVADAPPDEILHLGDEDTTPEPPKRAQKPRFSDEAKSLVMHLKTLLGKKGQKTFPRDWAMTSYAVADKLLKTNSEATLLRMMTWALTKWECHASVTHFKHLEKALMHFERTHPNLDNGFQLRRYQTLQAARHCFNRWEGFRAYDLNEYVVDETTKKRQYPDFKHEKTGKILSSEGLLTYNEAVKQGMPTLEAAEV